MNHLWKNVARTLARVAAGVLMSVATVHALPTTATYQLTFDTAGQSVWDTGTSNVLNQTNFLGAAWQNQSVNLDAIVGDESTNLPNPLRVAYDVAFASCTALFSATACINGQSARAPVPALGSRPSVRSCGLFAVGCQAARLGDLARRTAYDAAFATCRLAFSATVCRNGQSARLPVVALGTAPAQYLSVDTRTGFALNGTTDGRVGLNVGMRMDSGSVNATVSFDASVEIPDTTGLDKTNAISLNPNSVLAGSNLLQTTAPSVALSVDAVMQLSGSVNAEGCIIPTGCRTGALPFAINEIAPVLSFNADGEGGIELFGQPPSVFGAPAVANGFPLTVDAGGLGEVTLYLPQPNATGGLDASTQTLKASGQDDLVDVILDLDNIVATAAGLPGLFGSSFSIPVLGEVGFDIINVSMGPTIDLLQDFELDPTLFVTLAFDEAVSIGGQIVNSITSAWDLLPDITFLSDRTTVTPTFFIDALLHNRTLLDFNLDFGIDLLQIFYDFGALGADQIGIGNVLNRSVNLFQSPAFYEKLFALQGFNVAQGDSFVIDFNTGSSGPANLRGTQANNPILLTGISNIANIPEPGVLLLMLAAALAVAGTRRRGVWPGRPRVAGLA